MTTPFSICSQECQLNYLTGMCVCVWGGAVCRIIGNGLRLTFIHIGRTREMTQESPGTGQLHDISE